MELDGSVLLGIDFTIGFFQYIYQTKQLVMNLTDEIKWIQEELESVTDPAFLELIKNMLEYRKRLTQSERVSIIQYNKELEEAVADVEKGEFYTQEQAKKFFQGW